MHLTSGVQGSGVTTTQAFDPNTGLVRSILAGSGSAVANQTFAFDTLGERLPAQLQDGTAVSNRQPTLVGFVKGA